MTESLPNDRAQDSSGKPAAGEALSLTETLRIMDVASILRRDREQATRALDASQVREELRRRLQAAAEVTGEAVTAAEIDVAIQHYYANLHAFREPPRNASWFLAHLYIRRLWIGVGLILIVVGIVAAVFLKEAA